MSQRLSCRESWRPLFYPIRLATLGRGKTNWRTTSKQAPAQERQQSAPSVMGPPRRQPAGACGSLAPAGQSPGPSRGSVGGGRGSDARRKVCRGTPSSRRLRLC